MCIIKRSRTITRLNKMNVVLHSLMICVGLTLFSCSEGEKEENLKSKIQSGDTAKKISVSREILDQMMQTLPSPIETANIITKSKGDFKKEILIPSANAEKYSDKFSQALALGGYGVDLGYINLNEKTLYVIDYLENIKTIAGELQVDQFFDFAMLSNLAKNRNNVDSLIHLSTQNFNQIDEYLRTQNRGDLSVLILIGSWIEGLYMFSDIAHDKPSEDIKMRIGEQKIIIDNIYAILDKIEFIEYYKKLKGDLKGLKNVYDKITISYVYHEPKMKEVNGELVVEDNTETKIDMTDQQLEEVSREIVALRNKIFLK